MEKKKVKEELMKFNGGRPFMSLTELRKAMHIGTDGARTMVRGLYFYQNGKRKDYLVEDIAERICQQKQY